MRFFLERVHVDAVEHERRGKQHQRFEAEHDEIAAQRTACELRGKIGDDARHEETCEPGEPIREAPRADIQANFLRDG